MLFTGKCEPSLKTKIDGTKGYNKAHNSQDDIKTLERIRSLVCCMEENIQETRAMMKADKYLYTLSQRRNTKNDDYMKEFDDYIRVINYYGVKEPTHPGLAKTNLTKMGVQDKNNSTP